MRESSKQGTREAYANIFQAEEDMPNPNPDSEAAPAPVEGTKKRKSLEERPQTLNQDSGAVFEPPSISALELDGTMAQLGFNMSKFPHSNKKKKVAAHEQPEFEPFEPEEGAVVKKDEIDALFKKDKKGDKTKKEKKKGDKTAEKKEKKGKKRANQEEDSVIKEPEAVKAEKSAAVADSLKAVLGALEGGLRKSKKKKKGDGSGKQRTQNVMI